MHALTIARGNKGESCGDEEDDQHPNQGEQESNLQGHPAKWWSEGEEGRGSAEEEEEREKVEEEGKGEGERGRRGTVEGVVRNDKRDGGQ